MPPSRKSGNGVFVDVMGTSVAKGVRQQPSHRYAVAQRLTLSNSIYAGKRPGGLCSVLARLPYEGHGSLRYRIKSDTESFERIVSEADLSLEQQERPR